MCKKLIIISLFLFLLTGCNVNYNLKIEGNELIEKTQLLTSDANETYNGNNLIEYFKVYKNTSKNKAYFDNKDSKLYDVNFSENGLLFENTFSINDYYRSNSINNCFKEFVIEKNSDFYSLKTNSKCDAFDKYPLLDEIKINIENDYELIYDNADSKSGNIYTWIITRDNYKEKSISFSYDSVKNELKKYSGNQNEEKSNQSKETKKEGNGNNAIIIIGSIVALILLISAIILVKKRQL